jgi:hypothetical protein
LVEGCLRGGRYFPGRPGDDRTHEWQTNGSFDLPVGPNKRFLEISSGSLARAIEGWKLGWIFNLISGPALDIQAEISRRDGANWP